MLELTEQYRLSAVKDAEETGWRTDGKNGYVWLFATDCLSIFEFRKSRCARVAKSVLGSKPLAGVLVLDRYAGTTRLFVRFNTVMQR